MTSAIPPERVGELHGSDVYDRHGDKIGTLGQVWADETGQPAWASVKTGLFGLNESFVPLQGAQFEGGRLQVPHDKDTVKAAPNVDASKDEPLTAGTVDDLYQHYAAGDPADRESADDEVGDETAAATIDNTDNGGWNSSGDDTMIRSEERLNVDTAREEVGTARLRKYVVTEHQETTVPVQREEVRVEREPITDANRGEAVAGPDISEAEYEVPLHAERPVVEKEAVPVERVRLGTETVTDQETVGGEVRKEHVQTDLPDRETSTR